MVEVQFGDPYQQTTSRMYSKGAPSKFEAACLRFVRSLGLAKTDAGARRILVIGAIIVALVSIWFLLPKNSGAPSIPEASDNASTRVQDPNNLSPNLYELSQ